MSNDGQVSVFPLNNLFTSDILFNLQQLAFAPNLPDWLTPVGQAYRLEATDTFTDSSILFRYLARDVPPGYESNLRIYYLPEGQQTWQQLETMLNTIRNHASAQVQGNGIYMLIATVEMPPFVPGWNSFGYPIPGTRPITDALASIDGAYSSVYHYDVYSDVWQLFDVTVQPPFTDTVNTLSSLEFAQSYWISATEAITLYLGVPKDEETASPLLNGERSFASTLTAFQLPPATYYGWVTPTIGFTPTVGMPVTAWIDGVQCGESAIVSLNGQLAYSMQVIAEAIFPPLNGCGMTSRELSFKVGDQWVSQRTIWDDSHAHLLSLSEPLAVPAIDALSISSAGNDLILAWSHQPQNWQYEVWRSDEPYFLPGDPGSVQLVAQASPLNNFTDMDVLAGNDNHFYLIQVSNPVAVVNSKRTGNVTFTIVPGQ